MAHPTILICGNYGAGNFGDELILTGLLHTLREIPPHEIVVTSGNPKETAKTWEKYAITAIHFFPSSFLSLIKFIITLRLFRSLYHLSRCDLILFGGGCLFNEKESESINIWYRHFQWFKFFSKKLIIIGQSFGTFTDEKNTTKIQELITYATKIFVRDDASKKTLSTLAAPITSDIEMILDPALWLESKDFSPSETVTLEEKSPYALFILRDWPTIHKAELLTKLAELSRHLHEKYQLQSRIVILQKNSISDEKISSRLYEKIHTHTDTPPQVWSTMENIIQLYTTTSLIISMRLHGGLFGLILKKPTLFLNYDDKVENLLGDFNLKNLLVNLSSNELVTKADHLLNSALDATYDQTEISTKKHDSTKTFQNCLTKILNTIQ